MSKWDSKALSGNARRFEAWSMEPEARSMEHGAWSMGLPLAVALGRRRYRERTQA